MNQPDPAAAVTDRCPGILATHPAADGAVARIRLPGGEIGSSQLEALAHAAAEYGDGHLELTGRGNIQLRGIRDVDAVTTVILENGLLPSATHDRVRNILVSPFTGRIGGLADLRPMVRTLDELLRAEPRLAGLSGKFLFGLDDGRGDIVVHRPDLGVILRRGGGGRADLLVDGQAVGSTDLEAAAGHVIALALDFLSRSAGAWRVADLPAGVGSALVSAASARLNPPGGPGDDDLSGTAPEPDRAPSVGWFDQDDGNVALGGVVALGRLPSRLVEFIAAIGAPVIVTPRREIVICDLTEGVAETVVRVLAPMGLIFDANSQWTRVSSCVGAPGCAKSHADVRADLTDHVNTNTNQTSDAREHWVGCERGCGAPSDPHLRVQATPTGYLRRARDREATSPTV